MRVSVICPVYNAELFLAEAIDSVLAQDFSDFELLLVDDGSTDRSSDIAVDYERRFPGRIRCLRHPDGGNCGAAAARNLALAESNSELVAFIDADDRWRSGKLRQQVALLDANPEAGMVCGVVNYWQSWEGGRDRILASGDRAEPLSYPPAAALRLFPLGTGVAPCPSELLVRRTVIDAIGGFEPEFVGPGNYEDQAFLVKAYLAAPIYFAPNLWLDYRLHSASGMARGTRERRHRAMRKQFLDWFERYLAASDFARNSAVVATFERARWEFDHRMFAWLRNRGRGLSARLKK